MRQLFYLILILLYAQLNYAQFDNSKSLVKWINNENGLKQLSVKYCTVDTNNFLYIGTELGLYKYDGEKAIEIQNDQLRINKRRVYRLAKNTTNGNLYVNFYPDNQQYCIVNNDINVANKISTFSNTIYSFNQVCLTINDPIVASNLNNPFFKKSVEEYEKMNCLSSCTINDYLYLPLLNSIAIFNKKGLVQRLPLPNNVDNILLKFNNSILVAKNGSIIKLQGAELVQSDVKVDKIVEKYLQKSKLQKSNMKIFADPSSYYLVDDQDIYKLEYKNNILGTSFLFKSPDNNITTIAHLQKENLYFLGTLNKGVAVIYPQNFKTVLLKKKVENNFVNNCYAVANISNQEWYSTTGWFYNRKNNTFKIDSLNLENVNINFILPYKNNFYKQIGGPNLYNIRSGKPIGDIYIPKNLKAQGYTGYCYINNKLYISDCCSIYTVKSDTLTQLPINYTILNNKIINGIYNHNNNLIITTVKGVYTYSTNTKTIQAIKGLENVYSRYIKSIDKKSFWVGCYGEGLFLHNEKKTYKIKDKNFDINTIHAIQEDVDKNLWISTNNGLLFINKKKIFAKIFKKEPIESYLFTTKDGLLSDEFNGGSTNNTLQTKEGYFGFPSTNGFVWFNPEKVIKHIYTGNVFVEKITVKGKIIKLKDNVYKIPKEAEILNVFLSYPYHFNRQNITLSYKFENQKCWTKIEGASFQIPRNKKGLQKLQIKIYTNGFEDTSSIYKIIELNVEERYYEAIWFWLCISTITILLIYKSYRIGLTISKKRERQLQDKINQKTKLLQNAIVDLEKSKIEISESLLEKELLLKEVHHRVKNNLQLIMSMLNIQARRKNYETIFDFLKKGESRINTMALIHQRLYQGDEKLNKINLQAYCESLMDSIRDTFDCENQNINITVNCNNVTINLSTAIPIGLILNELITNSLKHAFLDKCNGIIMIETKPIEMNKYHLIVSDNGKGFDPSNNKTKSFGLELINLLVQQLKGTVKKETSKTTTYHITFEEIDI